MLTRWVICLIIVFSTQYAFAYPSYNFQVILYSSDGEIIRPQDSTRYKVLNRISLDFNKKLKSKEKPRRINIKFNSETRYDYIEDSWNWFILTNKPVIPVQVDVHRINNDGSIDIMELRVYHETDKNFRREFILDSLTFRPGLVEIKIPHNYKCPYSKNPNLIDLGFLLYNSGRFYSQRPELVFDEPPVFDFDTIRMPGSIRPQKSYRFRKMECVFDTTSARWSMAKYFPFTVKGSTPFNSFKLQHRTGSSFYGSFRSYAAHRQPLLEPGARDSIRLSYNIKPKEFGFHSDSVGLLSNVKGDSLIFYVRGFAERPQFEPRFAQWSNVKKRHFYVKRYNASFYENGNVATKEKRRYRKKVTYTRNSKSKYWPEAMRKLWNYDSLGRLEQLTEYGSDSITISKYNESGEEILVVKEPRKEKPRYYTSKNRKIKDYQHVRFNVGYHGNNFIQAGIGYHFKVDEVHRRYKRLARKKNKVVSYRNKKHHEPTSEIELNFGFEQAMENSISIAPKFSFYNKILQMKLHAKKKISAQLFTGISYTSYVSKSVQTIRFETGVRLFKHKSTDLKLIYSNAVHQSSLLRGLPQHRFSLIFGIHPVEPKTVFTRKNLYRRPSPF
jgi:hypothetical protein